MAAMRRALRVLLCGLLLLGPALTALAQDEAPLDLEAIQKEREARTRLDGVGNVRARISRYLEAAQKKMDEEGAPAARALLEKLNPKRMNPMERALVYRLLAVLAFEGGEYAQAVDYFEKVLEQQILKVRDEARIRFSIAQLYAAQQEWRQVIAKIHEWLRWEATPEPLGYYLVGVSYFQLDDFDSAIEWAEKAVDNSPEPSESWLQLLAALYVQKEQYASATPILEELVIRFPKKQYWVQLSLIYGARENYGRSLAAQQVAYAQGFLTEEKEILRLVRGYLYHELPYPAAQILQKALDGGAVAPDGSSYELLANSWIQAREYDRSLPPLARAAELSDDGNLYLRLGQVHLQREEWREAAGQLQKALAKGGLRNLGNAELLLGIAYYNDERVAQARTQFQKARRHDDTRNAAEGWLGHLERESQAG